MQRIEDTKLRLPRRTQDLHYMRNTRIGFCHRLQAIPEFASFGNEIVIRIDDEQCRELFVKLQFCHGLSCSAFTYIEVRGVACEQPQVLRPLLPSR